MKKISETPLSEDRRQAVAESIKSHQDVMNEFYARLAIAKANGEVGIEAPDLIIRHFIPAGLAKDEDHFDYNSVRIYPEGTMDEALRREAVPHHLRNGLGDGEVLGTHD